MLVILISLVVAAVLETHMVDVGLFVIASMWFYQRYGLKTVVTPIALGGIILDVLSPRVLGSTAIMLLLPLLVAETVLSVGHGNRERYWLVGILGVVTEGVMAGRKWFLIVAGVVIYVGWFLAARMLGARTGGIIVRREL